MESLSRRTAMKLSAAVAFGPIRFIQEDKLQSEFLLELSLQAGSPQDAGSGRLVVPVTGGTFEGPRLKGTIVTPGGDWIMQRTDGSRILDVRALMKTDDGQTIYVSWRGVTYNTPAGLFARILPVFETGAQKYGWLNNVVAVGVYQPITGKIVYRIYQIL